MYTPHFNQLQEASRILRSEIKQPKIERTVDVYPYLLAEQRQVLNMTERMKVKRLMMINPR